jgi:predicted RNA-binding Zn ribbon-like protein
MNETHDAWPEADCRPELFVELANELQLAPPDAPARSADVVTLRSWLADRGLLKARTPASHLKRNIPAFRELRSLVRAVAERVGTGQAPTRGQVESINRVMRDGLHYHALCPANGGRHLRMEPVGDDLDQARAMVAGSLAHYLAEHDERRLRICADATCGWLFIDQSPAGRRRWCDMRSCGNRAKVARFRARARSEAARQASM